MTSFFVFHTFSMPFFIYASPLLPITTQLNQWLFTTAIMLSLPLPTPIANTYIHSKPNQILPSHQKLRAASVDVDVTSVSGDEELPPGLRRELMPKHVAVIMDGNVRWARQRGLPTASGHQAGVQALKGLVELCYGWGIPVLTVFAFSADNWIRPKVEVDFLMSLFEKSLESEMDKFASESIQISVIGDPSKLPKSLQKLIRKAEKKTKHNCRLQLIVAVGYSGKYDVLQACKGIAQKVKDGVIEPEEIDERLMEEELETNCTEYPYPDLLIRTSGEVRVSNFLLWQLAYTELFFVEPLWPDFGKTDFVEALTSFQQRQRRYGGRDS